MNAQRLPASKRIDEWLFYLPLGILLTVVLARALLTEVIGASAVDCEGCLLYATAKHDLPIVGIGCLLHVAIAKMRAQPLLAAVFMAAIVILISAYVVDMAVMMAFTQRLYISDMVKFSGGVSGVTATMRSAPAWVYVLLVFLIGIAAACGGSLWRLRCPYPSRYLALVGGVLVLSALWADDFSYIHRWAYQNLIEFNLGRITERPFSEHQIQLAAQKPEPVTCVAGKKSNANVILLVVESLSAFQSTQWGGQADMLSNLPKSAQDGVLFDNFFANGHSTDHGLIATLTGQIPYPVPGASEFSAYAGLPTALGSRLHALGYDTLFYSGAELDFLNERAWLTSSGFKVLIDPTVIDPDARNRGVFNGVPDRQLYASALDYVSAARSKYLLVISTISTHAPYVQHDTKQPGLGEALRYADGVFGEFYAGLKRTGFFESGGIFLVTGDHRAMVPVFKDELSRYGDTALARVPLIWIGAGASALPKRVSDYFQQADIAPSVEYWVGAEACFAAHQASFFQRQPDAKRCVEHVRGDVRGVVSVLCPQASYRVTLDGDNTRSDAGSAGDAKVTSITRARIRAQQRVSSQ